MKKIRLIGSITLVVIGVALAGHHFNQPLITFFSSALALIGLSKILGDATEEFAHHVGEKVAGFVNVTLSNLAELIIVFAAVRSNLISLVQAGIVGSIIGNLLFVMGLSIYFGCRKNGALKFNPQTAALFINQFFIVATTLMLPTIFNGHIPEARHQVFSYILAIMLVLSYVYYYWVSLKDKRHDPVDRQASQLENSLSKGQSVVILIVAAAGAFFMSEFLVKEVEHITHTLGVSEAFIGFILLPFLGNISEHAVAITAARKKMTELSLAISVGSASQVGMVVAPAAVLFGFILGNPVTLYFAQLPLALLVISLVGAFLVLRDNEWNLSEGVMLIALYCALVFAFVFTQ